jgi:hypothetical protein
MKTTATLTLLLALTLAGACSDRSEVAGTGNEPAVQAATNLSPEQLGTIGAQIRKEPGRAQEILTRHGLNEVSFEKAIRAVTESPDASRRYADAYRQASA